MEDKYWWEKDEEEDEKKNGSSQQSNDSGYWWDTSSIAETVGTNVANRVNTWLKNHNIYVSNYQNRYAGRKFSYADSYVNDSASWMDTVSKQADAFEAERQSILSYMDQYKGYLDERWMNDIRKTLADGSYSQSQIRQSAVQDNDWWNSFGSDQELVTKYGSAEGVYNYFQRADGYTKKYTGMGGNDIQNAITALKEGEERDWLLNNQGDIVGNTIRSNADFQKYASLGNTLAYTDFGTETWNRGKSRRLRGYYSIDKYRAASLALSEHYGNEAPLGNQSKYDEEVAIYRTMTDEEFETLAYCIAYDKENGTNLAEQYVDRMEQTLSYRRGTDIANKVKDIPVIADLYSLNAGLDQFATGLENVIYDRDYYVTNPIQVASSKIRESMADDGFKLPGGGSIRQGLYDLGTTTANMAPSILASYAANAVIPGSGVVVGNALMGASATGNAYSEAVNRGFGKDEAKLYANAIGASEVLLGAALGGISKLGGVSPLLSKAVSGIDSGIARFALQYGGKIASEGIEEGLQEVLDPIFKNAILNTDENIDWGQVAYSALLGGLSAGLLEGRTTYKEVKAETALNKDAIKQYGDKTNELIKEGLESKVDSESFKLAQKYKAQTLAGKSMTGNQIRNLLAANQEQITPKDMKLIQKAAEKRLTDLGQTEDVARTAELATKRATGQELTHAERRFLASSEYGARVANELLPKNIESGEYTTGWAEEIGTKEVNAKAYNKKKIDQVRSIIEQMQSTEDPAQYKSLTERAGTEGRFGVSESGKAVIRSTGEEIDINSLDVATVGDGELTFKVGDREVSAGDIDFVDDNQSFLVSAVANIENITAKDATAIIHDVVDMDKPLGLQLNGIDEAFTYGFYGYSVEDLKAGEFGKNLTDKQLMSAYELGKAARKESDTSKVDDYKKMRTAADAIAEKGKAKEARNLSITYNHGNGKVVSIEEAGITDAKQSGAVEVAKILHKLGLGTRVEFFSSYETDNGRVFLDDAGVEKKAYSGLYREADGTIRVDLNAYNGRGLTLNALTHELTHFIQQWSETKYKVLVDFLMETYEKTDMNMHERVLREQKRLENIRGKEVSYKEAYDEVVANAMMKMFDDGKLVERLTELKAKDKNLAQKLWEGFKKILAEFLGIYEKEGALFKDTADLMEMKETFEQLQNMFAEALVEASENYQASLTPGVEGTTFNAKGEAVAHSTKDGTIQLSMHTYETEGKKALHDYLKKCVSSNKLTQAEMNEMIKGIEDIYQTCKEFKDKYAPFSTWSDAAVVRDTHGRPVFSVVTPNGDYKMNLDFSLVCKKRRTLDAVFNEMSKRGIIDDFELGQKSVVKINEIIRRYGFETACALCFVDAKRFRQASMADSFTRLYNELVESLVPEDKKSSISYFNFSGYETIKDVENGIDTWDNSKLDFSHINHVLKTYESGTVEYKTAKYIKSHAEGRKLLLRGDFMSSSGFDAVKTRNPDVLKLYNSKKGTGGPKAAFGDVQYMNEIIKKARWWTPAKAYSVGGVRVQSFSDYVPRMVFDYVQMVYDLAATKLPAHAYTKEALFVKQFGLTGIKINMSLIPAIAKNGIAPGLDANGNYVWAGESFDYETAKDIQNADGYTENCGTICVGVSYDHIVKLLNDPNIRMVIPYHKSGLNPIVAHMNQIAEFHDYTNDQRTKGKDGKAVETDFDFSKALHDMGENANPKAVADQYLKWCATKGYTPRFAEFAMEDNYYKLLEDFTLYDKDGNYVPQREVRAVFPTEDSAFGSMKSLIKEGLQEDAVIEGKRDKMLPEIVDEIQKSLPKTEAEIDETQQVEQADRDLEAGEQFSSQETDADKWKPNLDNTEWGIVNYAVEHNKGTAITITGDMFFEKSKGRTVFGIYSVEDSTLLYASRKQTAEIEHRFVETVREEYNNGRITDTSAEGLRALAKSIRMQRIADHSNGNGTEPSRRSVGNGGVHGRQYGRYPSAALRNVLANILQKEIGVSKSDRDYLSAVNRGDMETAQKMVDDAANEAGYTLKGYHGTRRGGFTVFKNRLPGTIEGVKSIFLAKDEGTAGQYAYGANRKIYTLYAKMENPLVVDCGYSEATSIYTGNKPEIRELARKYLRDAWETFSPTDNLTTDQIGYLALRSGQYDGVIFKNVNDSYSNRRVTDVYEVFEPEQVKSADPVTYDDSGNIIPLSQRFNQEKDDIRYSSQETDADGNKLTRNQIEFFKDSKVRDHRGNLLIMYHGTKEKFTVFDRNALHDGLGFFFTEDKQEALDYGDTKEYYLNISNPFDMFGEIPIEDFLGDAPRYVDGHFNYEAAVSGLKAAGYDGISSYMHGTQWFVAFDSEQVKLTSNKKPTIDPDIRYSEHNTDYSNRDLLANAFEGLSQNSEEYKMIQEYKGRIKLLNEQEAKLAKLNAEILDIRFTKGKYNAKKLNELEAKAKNIANDINRQDRKLLDMEASEPLRKVIEQERKKEAEKTKAHVKEIQQNKKLRAEQTELRHKIRKAVRDLDKLLNRGNKKANVKEDMKDFVSKALEIADYLFTDHISNDELIRRGITVPMRGNEAKLVKETEDIIAKLDAATDINNPGSKMTDEEFTRLDEKRKRNLEKLKDLLTEQRNERLSTPVAKLFDDLVKAYASLKHSSQDAVKAAYNEELEKSLRAFMSDDKVKILENMRVADMTAEELNWLYRAYTMVLTNVRNANKFHVKGMNETIDQKVDRIVSDFSSRKTPDKKVAIIARNLANKIGWDYEKLHYALDRIGSEAFTELIMNLANSENIVMADVIEAALFRDKIVERYGFNNWDVNKQIDREFLDNTGKKFKLTLGELMSLYAYSRREGAWDHIEYGGFVFGKNDVTNPKPADTYKLSKEQCEAITNTLTSKQKGYVEEMQKFLSETMGAKGNEVSMQLYGIKMFGEKNYFPIHIAGQFKAQAQESQAKTAAGFGTMSNAGFTHSQNPNAKAPFVLESFNEVWADHVNEMSRYHGAVPALEDIRRVMNRSSYSDANNSSESVTAAMENAFGKAAVDYFDNLYREANSGAITDKLQRIPKKLLSLFRKNSVAYSLSVLIQQPTSIIRAYAMIPKKYFGFKGFGTITSGVVKAVTSKWNSAYSDAYNEMLKYAPGVTLAKEIGGFDTHTGGSIRSYLLDTNKSLKQKWNTGTALEKGKAALDLVDNNAIANLPNVADKIAWIEIWNAVKRETVANHKDLAPNSEEFMQAVGERFTEVIRATQVYDSIFAKSPMMKSKNLAVQYLTSFMNEPNTVANMAESAVRDAVRGDWKSGVKKAAVLVYGTIAVGAMKSLIYALRDDDDDETYIEKYIESLTESLVSDFNPLSYIPVVRDISSALQGYDIERPDMSIIVDVIEAVQASNNLANKDTEDMTEEQLAELEKKMDEATWDVVESVASVFGIPVKNIRRDVKAIFVNKSANAGLSTKLSLTHKLEEAFNNSQYFFLRDESKSKQDKLYEAIVAGDTTYVNRLKAGYKDDDAYNSAIRKLLREKDSRIHEAALAYYNGNLDEYKRIFKEIRNDDKHNLVGYDNTREAILSEVSSIKSKLEGKTESSDYSATDYVNSILLGYTDQAAAIRENIINYKVAHGSTRIEADVAFNSSVSTSTRNVFDSGLLDEAGAEKMLQDYAGMDEEEAVSKVNYWSFIKSHPQYRGELSQANVEDYIDFAEPAEIPLDVFVQYLENTKGLKDIEDEWGVVKSKREQVLEAIDALPLDWQQKDALYLAAGYAESKIWDVPW